MTVSGLFAYFPVGVIRVSSYVKLESWRWVARNLYSAIEADRPWRFSARISHWCVELRPCPFLTPSSSFSKADAAATKKSPALVERHGSLRSQHSFAPHRCSEKT